MTWKGKLALKPIVSEVARLNDWLDAAFAQGATRSSIAADLKLCLNEIVVNLISYAFAETPDPQITVEIALGAHVAKAEVCDNGAYFDLRNWPEPTKPQDLMSARIGGYGILLIRDRSNSIKYERIDGENRLQITCSGSGPGTERQAQ
jgi:anti-sigma regulatory factor (Ser/Thr protein kinase)